ncbi:MAG: endonuclease/exonuclease/phosphatase family protein [Arachidicoccus sp.]|nr:endonuclease/exonuclease/phosphatase family protein [Arachidicoccus sp.]
MFQFIKTFLFVINIILAIAFLFAAFAGKINPNHFGFAYLLVLLFPVFLLINSLFFVWWLLIKPKRILISGVAILISSGSVFHFFSFHFFSKFNENKPADNIRIATWNINYLSGGHDECIAQIKELNPDILCLQEFVSKYKNKDIPDNIYMITTAASLKYHYTFYDDKLGAGNYNGNIIFSKYPIIDSGNYLYSEEIRDYLDYIDISINNRMVRIYTTHLQSNFFNPSDREKIEEVKRNKGNVLNNGFFIIDRLIKSEKMRSIQVDKAKALIAQSPYPTLFCGDCNDVPNSYTYENIKGNMQDVFIKKGFGIGRTYNAIAPTLRIDYIFADKNFSVQQVKRFVNNNSDHYMLVADLKLKN